LAVVRIRHHHPQHIAGSNEISIQPQLINKTVSASANLILARHWADVVNLAGAGAGVMLRFRKRVLPGTPENAISDRTYFRCDPVVEWEPPLVAMGDQRSHCRQARAYSVNALTAISNEE
jgi:hypothetical protein